MHRPVASFRKQITLRRSGLALSVLVAASILLAAGAQAAPFCPDQAGVNLTCKTGDGLECDDAAIDSSDYKMILTLPAGYQSQAAFEADAGDSLRDATGQSDVLLTDDGPIDNPLWTSRYSCVMTLWSTTSISLPTPTWVPIVLALSDRTTLTTCPEGTVT